ncbi:glycoprotease/Kae1 family metallohydrolase [Edhazardia aedis USNM 41457]|uniref:N(6)-L-threonylcarbamoyladenine synthase n=1 Tax=Edhazardia aedis (strain USNM 41457) TaxID=1003232 RepID=J9D329_EDHAE|nr:glycoprotease/Kae1 family metallohydrolase [Edhazardia aedis USNM 41457]|eukprot:EJW02231.1 glycoprotease/Kae1 family metallohydrolase [Edhazardia aedis USNM 41457]
MIVLGIEGSANKIGIGIIKDDMILANERFTFITPPGTGFIPFETAKHHRKKIIELLKISMEKAKIKLDDIDLFAYTRGPGIAPCLMVCALVTRLLSLKFKKPLIAVNHCIGHIEMGRFITKAKNPVVLYVSGGNTQVIAYSRGYYQIFGETLDVAVGNVIDRVARYLGLPNDPCPGYNVEKKALEGSKFVYLPVSVKGMDVSFSGVASTIKKMIKEGNIIFDDSLIQKIEKNLNLDISENNKSNKDIKIDDNNKGSKFTVADICFSMQEALFSSLIEVAERAMSFIGTNEVLITGGVGCNKKLQEMMAMMVKERNGHVYATDEKFCIDNGLMIAYTGKIMYESGIRTELSESDVTQRFRTDSTKAIWRDN